MESPDVIVVGTGNAAFSAALAARERGARTVMLEKGSRDWIGGNSWFTAGAYRMTHGGLADIEWMLEGDHGRVELPPYSIGDYLADMRRVTSGRCDPQLTNILVTEAAETAAWMRAHGVRWRLMTDRQAYQTEGTLRFWGGLAVGAIGGGTGLIDAYCRAASDVGIEIRFESPVTGLLVDDNRVVGVEMAAGTDRQPLRAGAVVIASGGFEASATLRAKHLGSSWDLALVRGTPHNTGEVLLAAIALGAQQYGEWEGCHAIAWDAKAPIHGDRVVSNRYSRQAYPFGIVVNVDGRRFIDEGADFRNYTYAKYGAEILKQPLGVAFQIFDAKTKQLLSPDDYDTANGSRFEAETISQLAEQAGIDGAGLQSTVEQYNAAVRPGPFDPTQLDGKCAMGIEPSKSNWAQKLDTPPYVAYAVACGITFTFGGVRINSEGMVLGIDGQPIAGLFAAGEIVGGLFYGNYPGGTGLASGAVFGRRAGRAAASRAAARSRPTSL